MVKYGDPWVRRYHPAPDAQIRIACFPHAGGSASCYASFSRILAPDIDVLAVQYPGRQDRQGESGIPSVIGLADEIQRALAPWTDRPLVLFGHSMGGLVAFEVARRLEQNLGIVLCGVVTSALQAPSICQGRGLSKLDDDDIILELRKINISQAKALESAELARIAIPPLRNDYLAIEAYTCEIDAVIDAPILAMMGAADPYTVVAKVQTWRAHTLGRFDFRIFPGSHFFVEEHLAEVCSAVRSWIAVTASNRS